MNKLKLKLKLKLEENWIRDRAIGRGANGTVSLAAVQKQGSGVFAVKSVDLSSCLRNQVEALENEIEILGSLSSPYVVEYLGDGVTAEPQLMRNLYMEYLPGGSVSEMAESRRRCGGEVDETIIRSFSFCIVSALSYLHSNGIVHCDVKGANVLVNSCSGFAKLADFGSAIKLEFFEKVRELRLNSKSPVEIESNNRRIMPRGSPLWMAPEVLRSEYQGPKSDVWSLGCTIIEMVTGKPAWEDKNPAETLCRIGYSNELPRLPAQLSEMGRDFLQKCLQREPDRRWSCDQLLKHPFLSIDVSPSKSPIHPSPRSILDFFNMDSDEEDEEIISTEFPDRRHKKNEEIHRFNLNPRIKELFCGSGPVWESNGWVTVRSYSEEKERASVSDAGCCSGEERTIPLNWESTGVEREVQLSGGQFAVSTWVDSSDSGGGYSDEEQNAGVYHGVILLMSWLWVTGVYGHFACKCNFIFLIYNNMRRLR